MTRLLWCVQKAAPMKLLKSVILNKNNVGVSRVASLYFYHLAELLPFKDFYRRRIPSFAPVRLPFSFSLIRKQKWISRLQSTIRTAGKSGRRISALRRKLLQFTLVENWKKKREGVLARDDELLKYSAFPWSCSSFSQHLVRKIHTCIWGKWLGKLDLSQFELEFPRKN